MTERKEFLKEIISLPGLSGYEAPLAEAIGKTWKSLCTEVTINRVGNLSGLKKGTGSEPRPKILLAAHMDAIGLIVTTIEKGFIHFTEVGGVDDRLLPGQRVTVHGKKDLPGIIMQPPDRLIAANPGEPVKRSRLLVDIGCEPAEVERLVRTGDLISFAQPPVEIGDDLLVGHSMDDRAAVALVTECLQHLQTRQHVWDVIATATVQEEESFAGAFTAAFSSRPDMAIAIDVTFAKSPGSSDYRSYNLSKGPTLGWGPNIHPAIFKRMKKLTEKLEIPCQVEIMPKHSGTDAVAMQITAEGIPTMVLGIPLRYMHSPLELVDYRDIERGGRLLAEFICSLQSEDAKNIHWDEKND